MVEVLLWIVGGSLCLLLVSYAYLIFQKIMYNRYQKRKEDWKKRLRRVVRQCLEADCPESFPYNERISLHAAEDILLQYITVLKGKEMRAKIQTVAWQLLHEHYSKCLKSSRRAARLNALYHIDTFRFDQFKPALVALVNKPRTTKEEKFLIYRILASFQYPGLHQLLCEMQEPLPDFLCKDIIRRLNPQSLNKYLHCFFSCPPAIQRSIVDVLGNKRDIRSMEFIEDLLTEDDHELRIRALKALSSIGFIKDEATLLDLRRSPHWQEKMMVAKLFGVLKKETFIAPLKELLADEAWWVRTTAAQAIAQYPQGVQVLQEIADDTRNDADPFAKDMAREWVARSFEKNGV
nr:HEAT repeat domain-containing protein [Evansella caseinilytica]